MRVYSVEYRHLLDKDRGVWSSHISQEGYRSLEAAQGFIESRYGNPVKLTDCCYRDQSSNEYYIHDIRVPDEEESK